MGFEREREGRLETRMKLAIVCLVAKGYGWQPQNQQIYFEHYNRAEHAHAWPRSTCLERTYKILCLVYREFSLQCLLQTRRCPSEESGPKNPRIPRAGLKLYRSTGDAVARCVEWSYAAASAPFPPAVNRVKFERCTGSPVLDSTLFTPLLSLP